MIKNGYAVCYEGNGGVVAPDIISRHRTLDGARRAYRKRNWWLFDEEKAQRRGLSSTGTFDRIYELEDGRLTNYVSAFHD